MLGLWHGIRGKRVIPKGILNDSASDREVF